MAYKKKYIDVSNHQGTINWESVKASGIDGVMIRAGYGKNNIDKQFVRNITECNRLGIPCGVFWFSYAYSTAMAKKEAEYCLAAIKDYKVELPVCFDFEYKSVEYAAGKGITITGTMATAFVHAFCSVIEEAGYYAMNYSGKDFLANYFDATTLRYDLWMPLYKKNPDLTKKPRDEVGIWQYSSTGSVDGISVAVDMDVSYRDYKTIIAKAGLNGLANTAKTEPEPEPTPAPEEEQEAEPWYSVAQSWVMEKGISDGANPERSATNADVWAMLYRALNK